MGAHEFTTPYTPQQNRVDERKNRTLYERVRCLLLDANLPDEFWGLALYTASDLRNMCSVSSKSKTPFEAFHGIRPNLRMLRVFGCACFVQIPKVRRRDIQGYS